MEKDKEMLQREALLLSQTLEKKMHRFWLI